MASLCERETLTPTTPPESSEYRLLRFFCRTDRVQEGTAYAQASVDVFEYNARSEVVGSERYVGNDPDDTNTPVGTDFFTYAFDAIGNRLSASAGGVSESYEANNLNQYQSVGSKNLSHDADGNQTSDGERIMTWTAENRLNSIEPVLPSMGDERVAFSYDYLGRRVRKTVYKWDGSAYGLVSDHKYLYDARGWNVVSVYDADAGSLLVNGINDGIDALEDIIDGRNDMRYRQLVFGLIQGSFVLLAAYLSWILTISGIKMYAEQSDQLSRNTILAISCVVFLVTFVPFAFLINYIFKKAKNRVL